MTTEHKVVRSDKLKRKPFNSDVADYLLTIATFAFSYPLVLSDTSNICICAFTVVAPGVRKTLSTTRDGSGREQPASALPSLVWSNQMCRIAITTRSNFPMEAMSW